MFVLKRAAARAAFTCPVQQISSVRRALFRLSTSQRGNPTLLRPFHQSRRCLVDEQKQQASPAQAETSGETVTTEPSITEQEKEVKEKSIATADVLENPEVQNAQQTAENAKATVSSTVDQVKEFASSAAETVQQAASGAAQTATQSFPTQRSPRRETRPGKILYVGNLFFEVTAPQLEAEFAKHGEISNTRVVTDDRGLSKGFAYVEFATQESADRAIRQLDQAVFQGRRMAVQYHIPRGKAPRARDAEVMPPSKTLFIGNMSYQMSDRDLNGKRSGTRHATPTRG